MKGGGTNPIFQAGLDVSNKMEDNLNGFVNSFMGNNPIVQFILQPILI